MKITALIMFFTTNYCENIPQLCDTYDTSKPSYVYINISSNADSDIKNLKTSIYYIENDLDIVPNKPV